VAETPILLAEMPEAVFIEQVIVRMAELGWANHVVSIN
jgi:hypothetical protein